MSSIQVPDDVKSCDLKLPDLDLMPVTINQKTKEYSVNALIQFPYFDAFLSDRWNKKSKNRNVMKTESKISNAHAPTILSNQINKKGIDVGNNMPFTLDIFDELINITQKRYIDVHLRTNDLSTLLECELFFGSKIIDKNMIVQYFDNSPNAKLCQLRSMYQTTSNKTLQILTKEYVSNIDENILKESKKQWMDQFHRYRGSLCLDAVIPNEKTIVNSLISILKLKWCVGYGGICRFENRFSKTLSEKLWQIAMKKSYHIANNDLYNHLISIAQDIISHAQEGNKFSLDSQSRAFLSQVMREMKFQSVTDYMVFAQADMATIILFRWQWEDAVAYFQSFVTEYYLQLAEKNAFIQWMIQYNNMYTETIKKDAKKVQDWQNLFYFVLARLNSLSQGVQYTVKTIDKYGDKFFQILGNANIDWLVDTISQNSGGKDQRTVAIAIVNYVIYTAPKPKAVVTRKLTEFVNDVLDLQWELQQTTSVVT